MQDNEFNVSSLEDFYHALIGSTKYESLPIELDVVLRTLEKSGVQISTAADFRSILIEYIDLPESARSRKSLTDFKIWIRERGIMLEL